MAEQEAPKQEPKKQAPTPPKTQDTAPEAPQKPALAIGRIVHYITSAGTLRPAIISRVTMLGSIDLTVFNSDGAVPVQGVALVDHEDAGPGNAFWPPRS